MSSGHEHAIETTPLLSLRAWGELRDATSDPRSCDTSDAALVAAAVLSDVRDVRDAHGDELLDTPAGSSSRRLANGLNSIEGLALAAQRLGVEALTARLRYDHDHMATACADMFWHLSEAAELLNGVAELRAAVAAELDAGIPRALSIVDVDTDVEIDFDDEVIDLGVAEPPAESTIDLRLETEPEIRSPRAEPDGPRGRIVAAAMGIESPAPAPVVPEPVRVGEPVPEPPPVWRPPEPSPSPIPPRRMRFAESWRARRQEVRREREFIVGDERTRGRGLRPRLPTWFSQGAATLLICVLLSLIAIGVWMLVANNVGPF
ncbi:MAG: hypothetical protein HKO87_07940 [Acidimicrobiia bacterium]|nr:hypothetical protein [Acidimicrobiia bacterium]